MPTELREALEPGERVIAAGKCADDVILAASRFGLWFVSGGAARRVGWHLISRARLAQGVLYLVIADEIAQWPDGTVVLRDGDEVGYTMANSTKVTDVVHQRVRASVTASRHLAGLGFGGWVVLRRVAGRDGLTAQVRLDSGADPDAVGFADAVAAAVADLWPETVERSGDAR